MRKLLRICMWRMGEKYEIPDNETVISEFHSVTKLVKRVGQELLSNLSKDASSSEVKLKQLYKQCTNEDEFDRLRAKPLLDFFDQHIGGWPIVTPNWNSSKFDVFSASVNSLIVGTDTFFDISIKHDPENPLTNYIHIEAPSMLGVGDLMGDLLMRDIEDKLYTKSYFELMFNVTELLLREKKLPVDLNAVSPDLLDIAAIQRPLTRWESKEYGPYLPGDSDNSTKMTLTRLQERHQFNSSLLRNLTAYVQAYFAEAGITEKIHGNTTVIADYPKFWRTLDKKLVELEQQGENGLRRMANYFGWRAIVTALRHLSKDYRHKLAEFNQKASARGQKVRDDPTAEERCLGIVTGAMPLAMGALYVRNIIPKDMKPKATVMVDDIEASFRLLLTSASWMDTSTHEAALRKLDNAQRMIAYPEFMASNTTLIDAEYENIVIQESYALSMMQIEKNKRSHDLHRLVRPSIVGCGAFGRFHELDISSPSAYYSIDRNCIIINAAVLQPPFFDPDSPPYYNYGAIGLIIGHEFTHGFDSTGVLYDYRGFPRSWATDQARAAFKVKSDGIMAQYNNYTTRAGKINGRLTLEENISDNGGMRAAYKGYLRHLERLKHGEVVVKGLEKYSPDQLFFLSAAQVFCFKMRPEDERVSLLTNVHSPPEWRINGVMSNMEEFATAFNCSATARLNPREKQIVW
ncbi:neprilysin-11-like isoform X1 [Paramacrobiotus metropolitanus]|uniref:neprilysin-11-like isoform X1 n=1 Tax=Paramacrobiotus metropolitanus TaxID=2943436 RepID=UPI002445A67C|nr:neprilysin-11-like isoform X1 [Paramacrobiotus metropolitanus]